MKSPHSSQPNSNNKLSSSKQKKATKRSLLFGFSLTLLVFCCILFFCIPYLVSYIGTPKIQKWISENLGRSAQVKSIKLTSITKLSFEISDIIVPDDPSFSNDAFLTISHLQAQLPFEALFKNKIQPTVCKIENLKLNLHQNSDKTWNWSTLALFSKNEQATNSNTATPALNPDDSELKNLGRNCSLELVNSELNIIFPNTQFSESHSTIFSCNKINGKGSILKNNLSFEEIEATIPGGIFIGNLSTGLEPTGINFKVNGLFQNVEISQLLEKITPETYILGTTTGKFSITGQLLANSTISQAIQGEGSVDIKHGEVSIRNLDNSLADSSVKETSNEQNEVKEKQNIKFDSLSWNFLLAPNSFETQNLICILSDKNEIKGQGVIDFSDKNIMLDYTLSVPASAEVINKLRKSHPIIAASAILLSRGKTMHIPVRVSGNIHNPVIQLDYRLTRTPEIDSILQKLPSKFPVPF